jgi:hypothetical protein
VESGAAQVNLREQVEADLAASLENPDDFGLPVVLISPDGEVQELYGQIVYDTKRFDPETGMDIVIHQPVVTLRRSSLARVPQAREKWAVRIPELPSLTAAKTTHAIERAPEGGKSIGFIRLYLTKAVQQ